MSLSCRKGENLKKSEPYRVQSIAQPPFSTLASNELLQNPEFVFATRLDSARVVKNVTGVIGEHELVVDCVLASLVVLWLEEATRKRATIITNLDGRVKFNLVRSEIRQQTKSRTTYLLTLLGPKTSPVNDGAFRCFTDPL